MKFRLLCIFVATISTSAFSDQDYDLGRRVGAFLGASLKADILKVSDCQRILMTANFGFYKRGYFNEAVDYILVVYKNNPEVSSLMTPTGLSEFKNSIGPNIAITIISDLGPNPSPFKCGKAVSYIEGNINRTKADLHTSK